MNAFSQKLDCKTGVKNTGYSTTQETKDKLQVELNAISVKLADLIEQRKRIDEFVRTSFSPFRGLWMVEDGDAANAGIEQQGCKIFMRIDSSKTILSRIIYCENKQAQLDAYSFTEMLPHYDSTTSRNSLSIKLKADASTCDSLQSYIPESKTVLFLENQGANNNDRIGSYAAIMFGNKAVYLNSGSNIPALLRTSNCDMIVKSAIDNPVNKLLQLAKGACELDYKTQGTGCFTAANNFVSLN